MYFYKILVQRNKKHSPFYNFLDKDSYIVGNKKFSFAIQYNPEKYNDLLLDNNIFKEFNECNVQQLIMTNQKFLEIIYYQKIFNIELRNCKFDCGDIDDYLDDDEIDVNELRSIILENKLTIKEISCITTDYKHLILQKNGVLGFDDDLSKNKKYNGIIRLIDTLNLGLKVIKE
ncbi:hypothetical protein KAR50_00830 [Periweissella fabaria]|uniref:Uncharacterized protein n=1 Tax=Periweissella fabaria TaxID=546157 RepID=A0ABM8Z4X7_9LACO|nr:hypothetical protein [Periweissella fabaria]MCM0596389.1 hypothetical protein [Periweissella fabaria]CAH0415883.1 hypothetical protein WFA24289_00181 [Periweissella fabaria]